MSFGKDENNQVHELNSTFNEGVVNVVRMARTVETTSGFINALANGRTANEISKQKSDERIANRENWAKEEIEQDER